MKNMYVGLAAIVVSVSAVSAASQGRNFSGTWTVDAQKTAEARRASGGGGAMIMAGGVGAAGGVMVGGGGGGMGSAGGGAAVARSGGSGGSGGGFGGAMVAGSGSAGGGAVMARAGGAGMNSDTVITLTSASFTIEVGETSTTYPLNGTEVTLPSRNNAHAKAVWDGDTIVITTTVDLPNGPVTSTTKWHMDGDSLVRETGAKTFYKRK